MISLTVLSPQQVEDDRFAALEDAPLVYDTMPPADELAKWWTGLSDARRDWLREHDLAIPFAYYGYPDAFAAGSLANADIQWYLSSPRWSRVHTAEGERRAPTMRWEYEHVVAIGGFDVMHWGRNKGWGHLGWVSPLLPQDPVGPIYLCCFHKPTSPYRIRKEQRDWLKKKLGRYRGLVRQATANTKDDFRDVIDRVNKSYDGRRIIAEKLSMSWEEFWRYAKGTKQIDPARMTDPQKTLFEV